MKHIRPKNWHDFQHYKDRSPSWIKLHKRLLDDFDFQNLPLASRALAPMLWLLASEYDDGDIPAETRKIAFRLRMTLEGLAAAFEPLLRGGFFEVIGVDDAVASEPLAEPLRIASEPLSQRREQVTSNKLEDIDRFPEWYALYPKKVAKHAAEKAYHAALKRPDATPELLLAGLKLYLASSNCDNPKFIAHPATWLNAGRWLDVPEPVPRKTSLGFVDSPAEEIPDAA